MSLTTVDGSLISSGAITLTTQVTGTLPVANGGTGTTVGYCGFKNRIINGAMVIDQRNAGASVTPTDGSYTLDRWKFRVAQVSKLTCQQNAGAVTLPVGFLNYLGVTSSSAYAVISTDYFVLVQDIEGFNTADLGFGTASASTITLSFQVRSSLTGTFSGALRNSAANRSYPFTYTISAASTWTTVSVTVAGDTSGTWIGATNGIGLSVIFNLGCGTTYNSTANSWQTGNYTAVTGSVSVVGTNGATFYITGVQLEKGSTATSFDYRPYGTEFLLCQRYYENIVLFEYQGYVQAGKQAFTNVQIVPKRTTPVVAVASHTNLDNCTSGFTINFGTNDYQHANIFVAATNGGLSYVRSTFNNFTFTAEL